MGGSEVMLGLNLREKQVWMQLDAASPSLKQEQLG